MRLTLCGSRKFEKAFHEWNEKLSYAGHVVYGLAIYGTRDNVSGAENITPDQKTTLDLVHLGKISNSDAIVVLNVDGYVGESTKNEIKWASLNGKGVYYIETSPGDGLQPVMWIIGD